MIERYRHDGTVRLRDIRLADKLNEVIDELNRQQKHITNVGDAVSLLEDDKFKEPAEGTMSAYLKESAKKEEKLYLTAEGMRAYDGSKWV